jgi:glycosyltransferase involved in cell wall biosynthesis
MTICIATDSYHPSVGGISTFYKNLCDLLLEAGHQVIILTVDYSGSLQDEDTILSEGALTRIYLRKTFYKLYHNLERYFRPGGLQCYNWIAMGQAMREWLLKNCEDYKIDIVEVVDYGGLAYFLCDETLPPIAITAHGSLTQLYKFNFVKRDTHFNVISKLETESFKIADAVIAHSPLNQRDLEHQIKRPIDFATIPWKKSNLDISKPTEKKIVVLASLTAVKGALITANAMQCLINKRPDIKIHWMGADSFTAQGQQSMAGYLSKNYSEIWARNFIWIPQLPHEEAMKQLTKSTIVVLPAVWETFNQVALEAASFGKAIIMTDKTGAEYLFTNRENALIVRSDDPVQLANAIEELFDNVSLCEKLSAGARLVIEEKLRADVILSERLEIYHSIRQRKPYKESYTDRMSFINQYTKKHRAYYYFFRSVLKKILKGK